MAITPVNDAGTNVDDAGTPVDGRVLVSPVPSVPYLALIGGGWRWRGYEKAQEEETRRRKRKWAAEKDEDEVALLLVSGEW